jgi:hypothetical protein
VIDRRTALICVTLIALMIAGAAWRIIMLEDWPVVALPHGAAAAFRLLFVFPAASALVVGALYWRRPVSADVASAQRWRALAGFVSIGYCAILLLLQAVLIAMSLDLGRQLHLWAIYRALGVLLAIMIAVAANQVPKLPYIERRFVFGGDLGPIYGPRFIRIQSRIAVAYAIGVIAFILAATPGMGWRPGLFIVLAVAFQLVWSTAWRSHLSRKWKREQLTARRV